MPQMQGVDDELRQEYFNSYIDTYLMRDVAEAGGITDTVHFRKFLVGLHNYPLEIKKSAAPDRREVKKYSVIDKTSLKSANLRKKK